MAEVGFHTSFMMSGHILHKLPCVFRLTRNEELRQSQAASVEQMEKYEAKHMGGFRRIFPREGGEKYEKYFQHSSSLFQETAASKAREECARCANNTAGCFAEIHRANFKQQQKKNIDSKRVHL